MRVTQHYSFNQILLDYTLHTQIWKMFNPHNYSCITITENIDPGQHISDISSKATAALGDLSRNLSFAPKRRKLHARIWYAL